MSDRSWSVVQLRSELERYEGELRAAGKEQRTIDTYLGQSERFVRFLIGRETLIRAAGRNALTAFG